MSRLPFRCGRGAGCALVGAGAAGDRVVLAGAADARGIRAETDPEETRRVLEAIAKAARLTPDVVLMDMRYQHSTS